VQTSDAPLVCPDMKSGPLVAAGLSAELHSALAPPCEKPPPSHPPPPPPTTPPPTTTPTPSLAAASTVAQPSIGSVEDQSDLDDLHLSVDDINLLPPLERDGEEAPMIKIVPNNPKTYKPDRFGEYDDKLGYQWYIGGSGCKHVHGLLLPLDLATRDPVACAPRLILEDQNGRTWCEEDVFVGLKTKSSSHDGYSRWTCKFSLCTPGLVRIRSGVAPWHAYSCWFRLLAKPPRARRKAAERRKAERAKRKREKEAMDGAHLGVRPKMTCPPRDGGLTDRESSIQPA